jgi:menaquinone-dependent protoporphyrinogen IX oxidase
LTERSIDVTHEGGAMAARKRVLVTYASKMGSTQEIAGAIGREVETHDIDVVIAPCADNVSP